MALDSFGGRGIRPNGRIRVNETAVYRGPHLYSHTPMIRIQVDLGDLENWPSNRIDGLAERLLQILPGLERHGCSYGEPGGFVKRLQEGTWLGHVTEHVALELQNAAGARVTRGKTRSVRGKPGVYNVMYAYEEEQIGLLAGRFALELVQSVLPEELQGIEGLDRIVERPSSSFDFAERLSELKALHEDRALGPTTASLVREARRRDIPVWRVDDSSLVQLGTGKYQKRIRASCTGFTSQIATEIASDKDLTKELLHAAGLPVPRGRIVRSAEEAISAARELGYPTVTKPYNGNHGRGVNVGLATDEQVLWGYSEASEHSRTVIVEQHLAGSDHRVLVIGGKVVAVAERLPAHVVGNGRSSIAELVEEVNRDPRRGEGHRSVLTRIVLDECVEHFLARSGLSSGSVPAAGMMVQLRPTANLSTGGTAVDRTDQIHPENALIARRAAEIVGLDVAGIDLVTPDISKPLGETGGGIVEVNAGPGFRMHLEPSEGRPRNVARPMMDLLFPSGAPSRIPVIAITGTNGKSTTARMLSRILQSSGLKVGLTSTTGVYINGERIVAGDCSGPKSARLVLREPGVDVAVLETARGGILREGLGFDQCDIGVVLNVAADHLGLKGIDTVEDLAAVKSVVVEAVHRDGWSILNADNPASAAIERHAGGRICYLSMRNQSDWPEFLKDHVAQGGVAVTREARNTAWDIVIHEDGESLFLMEVSEIPATFGGLAEFNVENALAAVAIAHVHGLAMRTIRESLSSFASSFEELPGRLNVYDGHGFRTIIDYAHNPDGLRALGEFVAKLRPGYRRTIGLIGIAGDRRDEDIREMGALASRFFDELVFKEDAHLRGREPGAVAALLREGALQAGCRDSRMKTVHDEEEAAELCLRMARRGDLVVMTADDVEAVWRYVLEFDKRLPPKGGAAEAKVRHLRFG